MPLLETLAKHLSGKHDQKTHGGGGAAGSSSASSPSSPEPVGSLDGVPFTSDYLNDINYEMYEPNPPAVLYHVAPKSARDDIATNGLDPADRTWNTGASMGGEYRDEHLWTTGDDGEEFAYEYRPEGIYMFSDLGRAKQYAAGNKGDIYQIDTEVNSREIIRDPSQATNWEYEDPTEHAYVTRYVEPAALTRLDVGKSVGEPIFKHGDHSDPDHDLGIGRRDMPQVDFDAFTAMLADQGIGSTRRRLDPALLRRSQNGLNRARVKDMAASGKPLSTIIASKDGHVLDGHHRWAAAEMRGERIDALVVDLGIEALLDLVERQDVSKDAVVKFAPGLVPVLKHGSPGEPGYSQKHPGTASTGPGKPAPAAAQDKYGNPREARPGGFYRLTDREMDDYYAGVAKDWYGDTVPATPQVIATIRQRVGRIAFEGPNGTSLTVRAVDGIPDADIDVQLETLGTLQAIAPSPGLRVTVDDDEFARPGIPLGVAGMVYPSNRDQVFLRRRAVTDGVDLASGAFAVGSADARTRKAYGITHEYGHVVDRRSDARSKADFDEVTGSDRGLSTGMRRYAQEGAFGDPGGDLLSGVPTGREAFAEAFTGWMFSQGGQAIGPGYVKFYADRYGWDPGAPSVPRATDDAVAKSRGRVLVDTFADGGGAVLDVPNVSPHAVALAPLFGVAKRAAVAIRLAPGLVPVLKHLAGQHDQKTHGHRGGGRTVGGADLHDAMRAYGDPEGRMARTSDMSAASFYKSRVADRLADRMSGLPADEVFLAGIGDGNDSWKAERAMRPGSFVSLGDGGMLQVFPDQRAGDAAVPSGTPEATGMVRKAGVSAMVNHWATSSNDEHEVSLAIQDAAQAEFGLKDAVSWKMPEGVASRKDALTQRHGDAYRAFVRAQYDETQAMLKSAGIDAVTVWRGMPLSKEASLRAFGGEEVGHYGIADAEGTLRMRPLSSWSTKSAVAVNFADSSDMSQTPVAIKSTVPASRVLATPATGVGCLDESEVVILGGSIQGSIIAVGNPEFVSVSDVLKHGDPSRPGYAQMHPASRGRIGVHTGKRPQRTPENPGGMANAEAANAKLVQEATTLAALPAPLRERIKAGVANLGITDERMDANIEAVLKRAIDRTGDPPEGKDWYEVANGEAERISDRYGLTREQSAGMVAATSPQQPWGDNVTGAEYVAKAIAERHEVQVDDLTGTSLSKRVMVDGKPVTVERTMYEWAALELGGATGTRTMDGSRHPMPSPDELRGKRVDELDPYVAAAVIKAHAQMGYRVAGIGDNQDGRQLMTVDDLTGLPAPVKFTCGVHHLGRAVRIAHGDQPDDVLNGHKVRSFYNNINGSRATGVPDDVTVDSHAFSVAMGRKYGSGSDEYGFFAGTGKFNGMSAVKADTPGVAGLYAPFADAYRRVAARHGMTAAQLQAVTWIQWRIDNPDQTRGGQMARTNA